MKVPEQIAPVVQRFSGSVASFNLPGGLIFSPSYLEAGLIVFLIFLLILTLGQLRKRITDWQMSGIMPGLYIGFALAIILEGFLLVGGRTILTEFLGWKNPPKPIANVLDAGRTKMVDVLGITKEVPSSNASEIPTIGKVMNEYDNLTPDAQTTIQQIICQ